MSFYEKRIFYPIFSFFSRLFGLFFSVVQYCQSLYFDACSIIVLIIVLFNRRKGAILWPGRTRRILLSGSFWRCWRKSFHSITIAMLAARCDISRNTFYYHYDDVYSLVKEIFADELVKVNAEFNATLSWEEGFSPRRRFSWRISGRRRICFSPSTRRTRMRIFLSCANR